MIIQRIILFNWKNFHDVDVNLTERCFVIGANAAGKSNFIDALRFLRDISKQSGGLQEAVDIRGGLTKIRCLAARNRTNISIEVYLGEPNDDFPLWIYKLNFAHTGGGIRKNQVKILEERVYSHEKGRWILDRPIQDNEDDETLKYTYLEQVTANKEFRDIQFFFQNIEYLNIIPQLVRESYSAISSSQKEDYYGRNFLEKLATYNETKRNAYFRKINEFLKLAVPQLEELKFVKDKMGIPHLEARYVHWRAMGSKQQEAQFSDGTLRLIGFLFALLDFNGVILLEEPELNLHSGIIAQLPEFISKIQRIKKISRQVIITTHSYDILASPSIGTDEVLVLHNTTEGTTIKRISDIQEIKAVVDVGFSIAEAAIPFTAPKTIKDMSQLKLDL